jgi:hypothetical protein
MLTYATGIPVYHQGSLEIKINLFSWNCTGVNSSKRVMFSWVYSGIISCAIYHQVRSISLCSKPTTEQSVSLLNWGFVTLPFKWHRVQETIILFMTLKNHLWLPLHREPCSEIHGILTTLHVAFISRNVNRHATLIYLYNIYKKCGEKYKE